MKYKGLLIVFLLLAATIPTLPYDFPTVHAAPVINFVYPTPDNLSVVQTSAIINVTVSGTSISSVKVILNGISYNMTLNTSLPSNSVCANYTISGEGIYTYQILAIDSGILYYSETRVLTIVSTLGAQIVPSGTHSYTIPGVGVNVEVSTSKAFEIYVGKYLSNPGGSISFSAVEFIDVKVNDTSNINYVYVKLSYSKSQIKGLAETSLKFYWWDGSKWVKCSDTGVDTVNSYIWMNITQTSTPSISQLTKSPFGAGGTAPKPKIRVYKSTSLNVEYEVSDSMIHLYLNATTLDGKPLNGVAELWAYKQVNTHIGKVYCFTYVAEYEVTNGSLTIEYPLHKGVNGFLVSFDPDNPLYAPLFYEGGRSPIWVQV